MSAQIIQFPQRHRPDGTPWEGQKLSKRQLAQNLGRSTRWVELRVNEGMPSETTHEGHRRFRLSDVQAWLEERKAS